jgi:RNA polymerase sigma factor (sigma-70 family)
MGATHQPSGTVVDRASEAFGRYQAGERAALDELVEVVTPLLWRTARAAGLETASAEDVVQTVWLSLLRGSGAILDRRAVVKWLLTTTRREAWRVSTRVRTDAARSGAVIGVDDEERLDLPAQRSDDLPDEAVLRDERQRHLWAHVSGLPVRCRQLISVIAFADRPDYAGIAEALGMPVGSIGPTRGRCLGKLRDLLAGDPRWEGQLT